MTDGSDKKVGPEGSGAAGPPAGEPEAKPSPGQSGPIGTIVSHYRIDAHIGRGGMGVVYKAYDLKLNRTVALKFLPPFLSGGENARKRFVAEARAASGLDHPNICTIYEIGDAEPGETFIAMAYYEGETLGEKIAAGSLNVDEAIDYAMQVARGLSKAHEAGIVHRDIKPANIIITPDGVAKILDFGLSKVEDQRLTRTGELLGTLHYMSPEQVSGEDVDAQADVWAVGAMLYEMLTGGSPFDAGNQAAVLYSVMHSEAPSVSLTNPAVSSGIARIVHVCLEKDKAQRFADAQALVDALEGRQAAPMQAPSGAVMPPQTRGIGSVPVPSSEPQPSPHRGTRDPSRRAFASRGWMVAGAAGALAIVLFFIPAVRQAIQGTFSPATALARASRLVAVIPSAGGTEEDEIMTEGLAHALTWEMSRLVTGVDSLVVLSATEILNLPVRTIARIREEYNVTQVITVAIASFGPPRIIVTLTDASDGGMVDRVELPLPRDNFEAFQEQLPLALASLMGLDPPETGAQVLAGTTAEAFDYYSQGLGYLRRYDDVANLDHAVDLFESALDQDSLYAPAHAGLCETYFELFRITSEASYVSRAEPRCDAAGELGRDLVEVLVPVASAQLQAGEPERALRTLREAHGRDSLNAEVHRWMGRVRLVQGETDAALESFAKAIEINPRNAIYYNHRAELLSYLGRHEEANEHFTAALRLAPDNLNAKIGLAGSYVFDNRLAEADSLLLSLMGRGGHARIFSILGMSYWWQARYADAIGVLESGLDQYPGDMFTLHWLANAQAQTGDTASARESWLEIVRLVTPLLAVNPSDQDRLTTLAEAHAHLRNQEMARGRLDRLSAEPLPYSYHVYSIGRTHELLGDRNEALGKVREAVDQGFSIELVERDPWLDELRADPRYQEIMN